MVARGGAPPHFWVHFNRDAPVGILLFPCKAIRSTMTAEDADAAKAKAEKSLGIRPRIVQTDFEADVDDISLEKDSGWRDLNLKVVDRIVTTIYEGSWGMTLFAGPRFQHGKSSGFDGKWCLENGKNVCAALSRVRKENGGKDAMLTIVASRAGGEADEHSWLVPDLLKILAGVLVGPAVEYPASAGNAAIKLLMCEMHEESNNVWEKASLKDKITTVQEAVFFSGTRGGRFGCWYGKGVLPPSPAHLLW